jgi:PadR family transcriptional regulator AphA
MDIKTLCLGLLTQGAASGYDLKKRFETCFSSFYTAGYGSIYPALAYLADTDLVTCEEISQNGRPDRKVYRITDKGRTHFTAALKQHHPAHKMRSEFLAMVFFSEFIPVEHLEQLIDDRAEELEKMLHHLEGMAGSLDNHPDPGVEFVAGFGETITRAALEYMQEKRHLLTARSSDPQPVS